MVDYTSTIAESKSFIILDKYKKDWKMGKSYQSEAELEREFIQDLQNQGYEYLPNLNNPQAMLANVRVQLQKLNKVIFSDGEWQRFVETYLDKPSDTYLDKTDKIQEHHCHDFTFDNELVKNIYLLDKKDIAQNKVQVIKQFQQAGNRYDVTVLVNGLPLVQIELKKRDAAIREAFNQVNRYNKESFNNEGSLYKYLQLFVISNGTDSRYFANTTERNKSSFNFTMHWAWADNTQINDLKDFTETFFEKNTLLNVLLHYSVFDVNKTLLVMRPYQIAATERILWKIKSSYNAKNWSKPESGGYIWHTTGSGKTLTSFKAAHRVKDLDFIDKVFFVVDRKDLDNQTMEEYQKLSPDSVNGSKNTKKLKENLDKDDNKIIVTTIQKLNNLMKKEVNLPIYNKQVVFIFDECHRSQFGEAQKNLNRKFKRFYQFGFTGTPIFPLNALGDQTTASVFGCKLHSYLITDAIRDGKVLKFKVDYNDTRLKFKGIESVQDEKELSAAENKLMLLRPERIRGISQYILKNYHQKTHRSQGNDKGFNAMLAVSSVDAAKLYYESLNSLQDDASNKTGKEPLKIATIFSFAANEEQDGIADESLDVTALNSSAKEFLKSVIKDYNRLFKVSWDVDRDHFQNYYCDLANRVKNREIDLLIVVGMFLTGFDAPTLNTLFVDKTLRHHGLIQAFSRTNRIYDATKTAGNIITFRDLEKATAEAITLFGGDKTSVLEKSYKEQMDGSTAVRGFIDVVNELKKRFPEPLAIDIESEKKYFVTLFNEYLRVENVLQNYDEFASLKYLQSLDMKDHEAVKTFKADHYLDDEKLTELQTIPMLDEREIQGYRSTYNDIRQQKAAEEKEKSTIDRDNPVFEIELLKSQEINLEYILKLIFTHNTGVSGKKTKDDLIEEVSRTIDANIGSRAKKSLVVDFINQTDIDKISEKSSGPEKFFSFAQGELKREAAELISAENLNAKEARRYINGSLKRGYASEEGEELSNILPNNMSPLNPQYLPKKQGVFQKIVEFVEKFEGIGGAV